jgi:hypothetical protein
LNDAKVFLLGHGRCWPIANAIVAASNRVRDDGWQKMGFIWSLDSTKIVKSDCTILRISADLVRYQARICDIRTGCPSFRAEMASD